MEIVDSDGKETKVEENEEIKNSRHRTLQLRAPELWSGKRKKLLCATLRWRVQQEPAVIFNEFSFWETFLEGTNRGRRLHACVSFRENLMTFKGEVIADKIVSKKTITLWNLEECVWSFRFHIPIFRVLFMWSSSTNYRARDVPKEALKKRHARERER